VVLKVFRQRNPDVTFHLVVDEAQQSIIENDDIQVKEEPTEYIGQDNIDNNGNENNNNNNNNHNEDSNTETNDNGYPIIQPGTPRKELEQLYVKDLRKYLRQKHLKYTGTRSDLVSRVLKNLKVEAQDDNGPSTPPTPFVQENEEVVINDVNNHAILSTPSTSAKKAKRNRRVLDIIEEESDGLSDGSDTPRKRTRHAYYLRSHDQ